MESREGAGAEAAEQQRWLPFLAGKTFIPSGLKHLVWELQSLNI